MLKLNEHPREPLHLTLPRAVVWMGAIVLAVGSLERTEGLIAALLAAPAALWVARLRGMDRVRDLAVIVGSLGLLTLGAVGGWAIGRSESIAGLLGVSKTLAATGVVTFGLGTFALVFGLRVMSQRWRTMTFVEAAVIAAITIGTFASHRDMKFSQPRFLADWAYGHGVEPGTVLLFVGVLVLGGAAILLLPVQRMRRSAASIVALIVLLVLAMLFGMWLMPRVDRPDAPPPPQNPAPPEPSPPDPKPDPSPEPKPKPSPKPKPKPGPGPVPGPVPGPTPGPLPNPHPWPQPTPHVIVTFRNDFQSAEKRIYFREVAFSRLNGGKFVAAASDEVDRDVPRSYPVQSLTVPTAAPTKGFAKVGATLSIIVDRNYVVAPLSPTAIEPRENADPATFKRTYRTMSVVPEVPFHVFIGRGAGIDPAWSPAEKALYTAAPTDPRYLELVDEILDEEIDWSKVKSEFRNDPILIALVIKERLEEELIYGRDPVTLKSYEEQSDPTAAFLFGPRVGKCWNIAQAMAALLRAKGIPSRVAAGYCAPAARRGKGAHLLLVDNDLHAWCEVYVRGYGWIPIEVTPKRSIDPPPPKPDPMQQEFFGNKNRLPETPEGVDDETSQWQVALKVTLKGLGGVLLMIVGSLYVVKLWRGLVVRMTPAAQLYRVAYRAVLDRLADVGVRRGFGETREEFANRLGETLPAFAELTAAHQAQAVGGDATLDRDAWRQLHRRAVAGIRAAYSRPRRLFGAMNPWSWFGSR